MSSGVRQIGVRLPFELRHRFEELADSSGVSISELLRRTVREYLDDGAEAWRRIEQAAAHAASVRGEMTSPEALVYGEWMSRLPQVTRRVLRHLGEALHDARPGDGLVHEFSEFVGLAPTGVWRLVFNEPIDLALPPCEQIDLGFRTGIVAESNETGARLLGYGSSKLLNGTQASKILLFPDATNQRVLRYFIANDYRVVGARVNAVDTKGIVRPLICTLMGTLRDGFAYDVWGFVQDAYECSGHPCATVALILGPAGSWCIELDPPVSTTLPEEEQARQILVRGRWGVCSNAFLTLHGIAASDDLVGQPVAALFSGADARNLETFTHFARSGYELSGKHLHASGVLADRTLQNSMCAHVTGERLVRIWGIQQDVTDFL